MLNNSTSDITSAIRSILRADEAQAGISGNMAQRLLSIRAMLLNLEKDIPSRDLSAFETANLDAFGYDTVLGFMSKFDALTLMDMADPVRETIQIGRNAARRCLSQGLTVVRVPACEHVTSRYAKVEMVNAYPISVLNAVVFGGVL